MNMCGNTIKHNSLLLNSTKKYFIELIMKKGKN